MVEDANAPHPKVINFRDLFLSQEEEDEESASLEDALVALNGKWPGKFKSADIAQFLNRRGEYETDSDDKERAAVVREFLFPKLPASQDVSAKSVGKTLKRHVGEPVRSGDDRTLILKEWRDPGDGPKGPLCYRVDSR
jgi:hypothetical protein